MAQAEAQPNIYEVLKQVAPEKEIELDHWVAALEDAVASAAKKQHRIKEPVRATLDPATGQFAAFVVRQVVEEVEDPVAEWTLEEAREHQADAEIGTEILTPLSTEGLGRIAAQSAKQVLYQRIREAEREKIHNEYFPRLGEVVNGTVRRFERGDIIVDLGRAEAAVPRREQSRHERYSQGERIRAVIVDVHTQPKGPQIILSRTDPRLLVRLFEMEVPEIYDGTVIIKQAVRAPGERAKVAVISRERDVDPVGACVGMKGSRVQSIIRELRGEKIDIIEHHDDLVTFAQSALAPAKITRVSVTHQGERPHLDVIVEDEQLSLAIGKRGQNVRLASQLIGAEIDIKSETDVKDEVADALARMLQVEMTPEDGGTAIDLTSAPGIGEGTAQALEAAGFGDLEKIKAASREELEAVEGIGPKTAEGLLAWAGEQQPAPAEAGAGGLLGALGDAIDAAEQEAAATAGSGGDDFLDALTKAFADDDGEAASAEAAAEEAEPAGADKLAAALAELQNESDESDAAGDAGGGEEE